MKEFHKQNIKSYANAHTIELAKQQHFETPKYDFKDSLSIKAGAKIITNTFFGEAHTKDNIVTYIPSEKVLFGGCAIKSLNATPELSSIVKFTVVPPANGTINPNLA